jgi:hypothetical protein
MVYLLYPHIHAMCEAGFDAPTTVEYGKDRSTTVISEILILLSYMLLHNIQIPILYVQSEKQNEKHLYKTSFGPVMCS